MLDDAVAVPTAWAGRHRGKAGRSLDLAATTNALELAPAALLIAGGAKPTAVVSQAGALALLAGSHGSALPRALTFITSCAEVASDLCDTTTTAAVAGEQTRLTRHQEARCGVVCQAARPRDAYPALAPDVRPR